ncbi:MAG: DEAD/DEAH box helicase [Treponema sp.]|jgi:superfamily II DNA/RNA helicase|nr:DEAD/DEAH box helicase [Treponema sp.]
MNDINAFNDLGICSLLSLKLKERGIVKPTAIQSLVIPKLLAENNVIFRSATGTGKTFAYLLPALQRLFLDEDGNVITRSGGPELLICAPTLELCSQIKAEADFLTKSFAGGSAALLIGSVKIGKQIEMLKRTKPVVAVGNPGRLLVLAKMKKLSFDNLRFLILDEADRLTVSECLEETKELLSIIERSVKTAAADDGLSSGLKLPGLCAAACSATVSKKAVSPLGALFKNAEIAQSDDHEILRERIEHWALFSEKRRKVQTLRSLLAAIKTRSSKNGKSRVKALVFTSRNDEAGHVLSRLQYHHISAAGLFSKSGGKALPGADRKTALDSFREGKIDVLVSTDLAARGLDIPGITHVIALDVPSDSEAYIHRCGRTARAGKRGVMATIGDETQMRLLVSLEKKLKICVYPKELYNGQVCTPQPMSTE